jgi:hypothetical protein
MRGKQQNALKGQKHLSNNAFALSGRNMHLFVDPGRCPGLGVLCPFGAQNTIVETCPHHRFFVIRILLEIRAKFRWLSKKACLSCKQGFFVMQTRLVWSVNKPCLKTEQNKRAFQEQHA